MKDDAAQGDRVSADFRVNRSEWDLVGPTIEDDVRRLIDRYGSDAVKSAVKEATRSRRGRPKIDDALELKSAFERDARVWLGGGDPLAERSNYAIAKEFSIENPGQSAVSTARRIERKLSKKPFDRKWFMLAAAVNIASKEKPYKTYIQCVNEINGIDPFYFWDDLLWRANSLIADYRIKKGSPPSPDLSLEQIQEGLRDPFLVDLPHGNLGALQSFVASQAEIRTGGE